MVRYSYDRRVTAISHALPGQWIKLQDKFQNGDEIYAFVMGPLKNGGLASVMFTLDPSRPRATPKPKKTPINPTWLNRWEVIQEHDVPEKIRHQKPSLPDPNARDVIEASQHVAGSLTMGPGQQDNKNTEILQRAKKLPAKNRGDLESALYSAGYYAKQQNKTMYVYPGNSFGHQLWRVSYKASEYLNPINNTGSIVFSVTPELVMSRHEIHR